MTQEHLCNFKIAEILVRGGTKKPVDLVVGLANVADDILLAKHYPNSKLHSTIKNSFMGNNDLLGVCNRENELKHLRELLSKIVTKLLGEDESTHGVGESKMMIFIVREILIGSLIQPSLEMLADPDWVNQTFDILMDNLLQSQQDSLDEKPEGFIDEPKITTVDCKLPSFQDFVSKVKLCKNIDEAEDIRSKVVMELQKNETCADQSEIKVYMKMLNSCLIDIDKRILVLSTQEVNV